MPTYGKIHSMPVALQTGVNEMLQAGKSEQEAADWVNTTLQKAAIPGLPADVTQQNISSWRHSGYQKWLANERTRRLVEQMAAVRESTDPAHADIADKLAASLLAELVIELAWVKDNYEPGDERAKRLLSIVTPESPYRGPVTGHRRKSLRRLRLVAAAPRSVRYGTQAPFNPGAPHLRPPLTGLL